MKVKELIQKLSELPEDMQVMIDHTTDTSSMHKFASIEFCDEVEDNIGGVFALISHYNLDEEPDNQLTEHQ